LPRGASQAQRGIGVPDATEYGAASRVRWKVPALSAREILCPPDHWTPQEEARNVEEDP
jgi:hypothetical protein